MFLFNGTSLENWSAPGKADEKDETLFLSEYGALSIRDRMLVINRGDPMSAAVWKGSFPRTAYEISLEAMRLEGDDFFCGMTFPIGAEYTTLIVGGWGGTTVGLSNVDGFPASGNDTTYATDFENKRWYPIKVRVTDAAVQVWLEEKKIIDQERVGHTFSIWPQQHPCRPFGISAWRTTAALRNITCMRLPEKSEGGKK